MKIRNLMIALAAVAMFAVPQFALGQAEDDCDGVLVLTDGTPVTVNPVGDATPTGPLGECTAGDGLNDSWLHFVATTTEVRIRTDLTSIGTDSDIVVYTKDCANKQVIGCQEDIDGGNFLNDFCVTGLTIDDTYIIRVGDWGDFGGAGATYDVVVTEGTAGGEFCGDGTINCGEACDGAELGSCLAGLTCDSNCQCPKPICGNDIAESGEECDGADDSVCELSCEGDCTCTDPVCGNNVQGPGEECDGTDDGNCILTCLGDCTCEPVQTPALPAWGVVGLALLLLAGGAFAFRRRNEMA